MDRVEQIIYCFKIISNEIVPEFEFNYLILFMTNYSTCLILTDP